MTSQSTRTIDDAQQPTPAIPLWKIGGFRNFWLSRTVSGLGSAITLVVLPVLVYQKTGSPVLVSLVSAAETIPYVVFGLIAGALADRVNRRRLMITTDLLNGLLLASVPVAAATGHLYSAQLIAVALLSSTLFIFFDAGGYGLVPAVVGKENLTGANTAVWGSQTVVRIVGTASAGVLMALFRPSGALVFDAVSFLASACFIRAVTVPPTDRRAPGERPGFRQSISEGLRFLFGHPTLRTMTIVGSLQSLAGGAILGQMVVFADRVLNIREPDPRIGFLFTAWSGGGIAGSLLLPRLRRRLGAFELMLVALPLSSVLGLLVLLSSNWIVTIVGLILWGTVYLMVLVNTMTYSQEVTPPELQGRVNTTRRMLSSGLGVPCGALVASTMTEAFSIRVGMFMAPLAIGVAAIIVWGTRASEVARRHAQAEN